MASGHEKLFFVISLTSFKLFACCLLLVAPSTFLILLSRSSSTTLLNLSLSGLLIAFTFVQLTVILHFYFLVLFSSWQYYTFVSIICLFSLVGSSSFAAPTVAFTIMVVSFWFLTELTKSVFDNY